MKTRNLVVLLGHVGADPDVHVTGTGDKVARVSLATSGRRRNAKSGEYEDTPPEWHRLTFFRELAGVVGQYVKKGDPLYVEGRLHYTKWTDDQGVERWSTEIIVRELSMLGGKKTANGREPEPPVNDDDDLPF